MLVREYLPRRAPTSGRCATIARVVLTGMFCEQPPLNLIKSTRDVRLLRGGRRSPAGHPLAHRRRRYRGRSARRAFEAFLHHSESTAAKYEPNRKEKGQHLVARSSAPGREGVIFAAPKFLRSCIARAADAAARAQGCRYPLHRIQVRRELRPDAADPGAGRHIRRFDQTVERCMNTATKIVTSKGARLRRSAKMLHGEAERNDGGAL